jgi:hypothetical protein
MSAYIRMLVIGLSIVSAIDLTACQKSNSPQSTTSMLATQTAAIARNQVNSAAAIKMGNAPSMPPLPTLTNTSHTSSTTTPQVQPTS